MVRQSLALAFFGLLSTVAVSARAQDTRRPDEFETPRGMALGSGVRASAAGTSAVAYNPANLPVARGYPLESTTQFDPTYGRLAFGAALADSTTDYLHAGFALRGIVDTSGHSYAGMDGKLTLALPIGNMFAIGLGGRYASLSRSGMASPGVNNVLFQRFTFEAAVRVTPVPGLHIAAIGTNLISTGSELAPRLVGGSASYTLDSAFTIGGDVLFDVSDTDVPGHRTIDPGRRFMAGGGVEWLLGGRVPLRGGYFYRKSVDGDVDGDVHAVSAGVGYVDPKYALDLALRQEVATTSVDAEGNPRHLQTVLLLAFRYFVQ